MWEDNHYFSVKFTHITYNHKELHSFMYSTWFLDELSNKLMPVDNVDDCFC